MDQASCLQLPAILAVNAFLALCRPCQRAIRGNCLCIGHK